MRNEKRGGLTLEVLFSIVLTTLGMRSSALPPTPTVPRMAKVLVEQESSRVLVLALDVCLQALTSEDFRSALRVWKTAPLLQHII